MVKQQTVRPPGHVKRLDIQVLRGWAVAIVVLDHARLGPFEAGFLGVDVFFVISGFLIGGIVLRDLDSGCFSFREFYLKRARRILPAAYVTMILTALAGIWFLTSIEFKDLKDQMVGGVTFTINFLFASETDYFSPKADTKPLLHMWSLAVEEQFYLIFPAILFLVPRSWRAIAISAFALISLIACLVMVSGGRQVEAFYLLPSRAWELLIGSLLAVFALELSRHQRLWDLLFWPALGGLISLPFFTFGQHPGIQAAAVCLCTAAVILANKSWLGALSPIRWLGDVSYSLYLVHWPIAVFAFSSYYGSPSIVLKLAICG